eukprot:1252981-Rhodomonas_salina.1
MCACVCACVCASVCGEPGPAREGAGEEVAEARGVFHVVEVPWWYCNLVPRRAWWYWRLYWHICMKTGKVVLDWRFCMRILAFLNADTALVRKNGCRSIAGGRHRDIM